MCALADVSMPSDLDANLARFFPRILQFSCHADGPTDSCVSVTREPVLQYSDYEGSKVWVTADSLQVSLLTYAHPRLQCIFLNGCSTVELA